ncbi:NAD(P)H-hydrate dehydratase [Granulosicoccus antarcticus]|uniref:Bifunctional NAD(P)H-hydrate repair enzyme n=1 Tax=Granulosicoccus antarcticus IMCC3135 TaxID=1192854 RepID=A0A2Z2NV36_9GAMM|nr:NAD(P)H-hydrate dehydratase [Granulosicoccus antarcticus]ASJ71527.1 Bifunctional NAD(P)H-hydrate repair enzyme Nnr [Granulosicoccus antarcticus IMCC3135]
MLLSAAQMQRVDATAVEQGINSFELMCSAGQAVADTAVELLQNRSGTFLVLAGPGNNGGDGAIAAQELAGRGYQVVVVRFLVEAEAGMASGNEAELRDADRAFAQWRGVTFAYTLQQEQVDQQLREMIDQSDVIIDALFGAGLKRPLQGLVAQLVEQVNMACAKVLAVDVPSGLNGNTHGVDGVCIKADTTVTFFLHKPAHFLYPGRELCGRKTLAQIGLSKAQLNPDWPLCVLNEPDFFLPALPVLGQEGHKFDRGHVLVRSGPLQSTGASRLSAQTALECGAGLVTLASSNEALSVNAAHLTAVMLKPCDNISQWQLILQDQRINTVIVGPGNGVDAATRGCSLAALQADKHCVLDADALSCWTNTSDREQLFEALLAARYTAILTPHTGEFERLFGELSDGNDQVQPRSRLHLACAAARLVKAVVVFKGADTVIAAPDGRSAINANAPPWLATAGAGDVLAGVIASLSAQGMSAFEAACAGVWMHGQAAMELGYPMSAEHLATRLPQVVHALSPVNKKGFGETELVKR